MRSPPRQKGKGSCMNDGCKVCSMVSAATAVALLNPYDSTTLTRCTTPGILYFTHFQCLSKTKGSLECTSVCVCVCVEILWDSHIPCPYTDTRRVDTEQHINLLKQPGMASQRVSLSMQIIKAPANRIHPFTYIRTCKHTYAHMWTC